MATLKKPSVIDVARHASVSPGTVSRVMNGYLDVDPEIRRHVLISSRKIGFTPRRQHHCIALIVDPPPATAPAGYTATLIAQLTRQLGEQHFSLELITVDEIELAYEAHVRGAIGIVFDRRISRLLEIPNLPILTVNMPMTELGIHSIRTDHFQQGELATAHLLAHGHHQIAFLECSESNWGSQQRLAGYRNQLERAGVECDPHLVQYTAHLPLYEALSRWVKNGVTALVNFSEANGLEAIHILTNIFRLNIPRDISVVTMEDQRVFEYLSPPQTVVRQPMVELARIAGEQMLRLCQSRRPGRQAKKAPLVDMVLPSELIERESVAMRPVSPTAPPGITAAV